MKVPDQITLQGGGVKDLDQVMAVMENSFEPCYGEAWTASQCSSLLPMPGVWLTLAKSDDEVVGFALARVVVKEAELLLLAVQKNMRCRGIGELLLETFIQSATQRGADRLYLEVRDGNDAISLYKKSGFTQVGRRRGYYNGRTGQSYDALTLSRKI